MWHCRMVISRLWSRRWGSPTIINHSDTSVLANTIRHLENTPMTLLLLLPSRLLWYNITINIIILSIDACMVWRHDIFPTTFRSSLILTAAISGHRHPYSWQSDVHGCLLSAIVSFRWPASAFETVCHVMSRQLQHSPFSGIASRHNSSQDHFLHNLTVFLFLLPTPWTVVV